MVFMASDRLLTTDDIEFEPQATKVTFLTSSVSAMFAGDAAFQAEIIQELKVIVNGKIFLEPERWLEVQEVANLYLECRARAILRRAEHTILRPLGLTAETFLTTQKSLNSELVNQITKELINFEAPHLSMIFCGVDIWGSHVFVVRDAQLTCNDSIGFGAIGSGARHAQSQFMFARYTPSQDVAETLLITYLAKKRSEVAPGVGTETDFYVMGPGLGVSSSIRADAVAVLEKTFKAMVKAEERAQKKAQNEIRSYVDEINQQTPS